MNLELITWIKDGPDRSKVLKLLQKNGHLLPSELADEFEVHRASISRILKDLKEKELVVTTKSGSRTVSYSLSDLGRKALENRELFDGVFLSIRNLTAISNSHGRVNVCLKLMKKIAEITRVETAPSFWSRLGPIGLAALDLGENYCSVPPNLNLEDVFRAPGGPPEKVYHFGRIINPNMRERWYANQVQISVENDGRGLSPLEKYWSKNLPTDEELIKPALYRINFAKPHNIATFNNLQDDWEKHISDGDTNPGREFLQSFEAPYCSWGLR